MIRLVAAACAWLTTAALGIAMFWTLTVGGYLGGLADAASTLVAFALFQPLRRRVQQAVDRRFDRARYDGQTTTTVFADRVRNEVDLVTLRDELVATASDAVRPTGAALLLRARGGS